MRVVADANIFVSAAFGRSPLSPSVQIIDAALDGRIELVMSPALLEETADVLSRPRIRKRLSADDAQLFLADAAAQVVMLADPLDPATVCRDPDDHVEVVRAHTRRNRLSPRLARDALRNDETPVATGVSAYRYRDSKPAFEE